MMMMMWIHAMELHLGREGHQLRIIILRPFEMMMIRDIDMTHVCVCGHRMSSRVK